MSELLDGVELLLIGNDSTISVELRDVPDDMFAGQYDGDLLSAASPQVTVTTAADVEVSGVTWPVSLSYDATEGQYNGVIPYTAVLAHATAYIVVVTAGSTLRREYPAVAWDPRGIRPNQDTLRKIAVAAGIL